MNVICSAEKKMSSELKREINIMNEGNFHNFSNVEMTKIKKTRERISLIAGGCSVDEIKINN